MINSPPSQYKFTDEFWNRAFRSIEIKIAIGNLGSADLEAKLALLSLFVMLGSRDNCPALN
jgi:hypothetical protein